MQLHACVLQLISIYVIYNAEVVSVGLQLQHIKCIQILIFITCSQTVFDGGIQVFPCSWLIYQLINRRVEVCDRFCASSGSHSGVVLLNIMYALMVFLHLGISSNMSCIIVKFHTVFKICSDCKKMIYRFHFLFFYFATPTQKFSQVRLPLLTQFKTTLFTLKYHFYITSQNVHPKQEFAKC